MSKQKLIRNPIFRKEKGSTLQNHMPDLAYEISEQDLNAQGGDSTPVCASILVSAITANYVSCIVTAVREGAPDAPPNGPGTVTWDPKYGYPRGGH